MVLDETGSIDMEVDLPDQQHMIMEVSGRGHGRVPTVQLAVGRGVLITIVNCYNLSR